MKLPIKPRLIIFDLDRTLWPFGIDEYVFKPPYQKCKTSGEVRDAEGKPMHPFPEVPYVLRSLSENEIDLAAASRTTFPGGAHSLISLFGWEHYFKYRQIFPGSKVTHFANFKKIEPRVPYEEMLFFDDEQRNIADVGPLGVTAILVNHEEGVTMKVIGEGIKKFAAAQAARSKPSS